jgi:siroheme synthase-like protein
VGGGTVAARKIRGLLECGAAVTVVAPTVHEAIAVLAEQGVISQISGPPLAVQLREYRDGEAARYDLVFSATGDVAVDSRVYDDANGAGKWVNSADDADHSSFILPAVFRDGPVTVAVSSSGASPALSTWLRDNLASNLKNGIGQLAKLLSEARRRMRESGTRTDAVDWVALLNGPPGLVAEGRLDEARAVIDEALANARGETQETRLDGLKRPPGAEDR